MPLMLPVKLGLHKGIAPINHRNRDCSPRPASKKRSRPPPVRDHGPTPAGIPLPHSVPMNLVPLTLADIPRRHARCRPYASAARVGERVTSYAQLNERSSRIARALHAAGSSKGERVAYLGMNCDEYFEL